MYSVIDSHKFILFWDDQNGSKIQRTSNHFLSFVYDGMSLSIVIIEEGEGGHTLSVGDTHT